MSGGARLLALAAAASVALGGCAGGDDGSLPASASAAPRDAAAWVSIVTDGGSEQWRRAERLLEAFPGAKESLVAQVDEELDAESLDWSEDVAPAIGPELVVVVTADRRPVVLVRPAAEAELDALLRRSEEQPVRAEVAGWTALAESEADLAAYRAALETGTLEESPAFAEAVSALPDDAAARAWVDLSAVTDELRSALDGTGADVQLSLESLAAAVSAEEDGVLLKVGIRAPDGAGETSYRPELFASVPDGAVAALSFGGTQEAVDRIGGMVDLDGLSGRLEDLTGLSLDGVLDALSGEGLLYVRPGEGMPEVTVVLAPPDVDGAWRQVDGLARRVAADTGGTVATGTVDGLEVSRLDAQGVSVRYARIGDAVVATTSEHGIEDFRGSGPKLVDGDAFRRAAEVVELGERTSGFVYVDVDGLLALAGDTGEVPSEALDALGAVDAFVLEADRMGETTTLSGFVRIER
jgi:hypothetical protein